MAITVNLRYTGKKGAAQAFAREMISSGTVEKSAQKKEIFAMNIICPLEKKQPAAMTPVKPSS